jgi:hypothetical protein
MSCFSADFGCKLNHGAFSWCGYSGVTAVFSVQATRLSRCCSGSCRAVLAYPCSSRRPEILSFAQGVRLQVCNNYRGLALWTTLPANNDVDQ